MSRYYSVARDVYVSACEVSDDQEYLKGKAVRVQNMKAYGGVEYITTHS
jgi:hypothetical protein